MKNNLSKKSPIAENDNILKEDEETKREIKSRDEFYSLIDKAYYIDELHYKIGT
jgi:hypothetical protein